MPQIIIENDNVAEKRISTDAYLLAYKQGNGFEFCGNMSFDALIKLLWPLIQEKIFKK